MKLRNCSELKQPKFSEDYVMVSAVLYLNEPESYEEVIDCKEHNFLNNAMDSEINSLKENNTWTPRPLRGKAKALPCKWVFRIKKIPDYTIDKYKARLGIKKTSIRDKILFISGPSVQS